MSNEMEVEPLAAVYYGCGNHSHNELDIKDVSFESCASSNGAYLLFTI